MSTRHTTYAVTMVPLAQADDIHADLVALVEPQCERHFRTDAATHTVDGTDYVRVSWVVRPEVAAALADLADTYTDLSINSTATPYADVTYPTMPAQGEPVERGQVYEHEGTLYLCRQSGTRTEHAPGDIPAIFAEYRQGDDLEWSDGGEMLEVGDVRTYQGDEYIVRQAHQTLPGREPDVYQAGWWRLVPVSDGGSLPEWEEGIQWERDDLCTYNGNTYICLQSHTSFVGAGYNPEDSPSLWELYSE